MHLSWVGTCVCHICDISQKKSWRYLACHVCHFLSLALFFFFFFESAVTVLIALGAVMLIVVSFGDYGACNQKICALQVVRRFFHSHRVFLVKLHRSYVYFSVYSLPDTVCIFNSQIFIRRLLWPGYVDMQICVESIQVYYKNIVVLQFHVT